MVTPRATECVDVRLALCRVSCRVEPPRLFGNRWKSTVIDATRCNMKLGDLGGQIPVNYLIWNGSGGGTRTPDTRIMIPLL